MNDLLKTLVDIRVKYLQHMKEIICSNTIGTDIELYQDLYAEVERLEQKIYSYELQISAYDLFGEI